MEFTNYKTIRAKLKKKGLLFKKPNLEDATGQFHSLARQLDDHKLYSGLCQLAIAKCQGKSGQVGALLNAARAFAQASYEIISIEDHIKAVIWIYSEALHACDGSFVRPIYLEMGRFYESFGMHQQAAECFKQSMSISRCVNNLILSKRYINALEELKNCPSHLMTTKDHASMFLLELLLSENSEELNRGSLQQLRVSSESSTERGPIPIDDHLCDLSGLLESLLLYQQSKKSDSPPPTPDSKNKLSMKNSITDKLSAFLDPPQVHILNLITAS